MYQYTFSEPSEGKENYPLRAKRFVREPLVKQTLLQDRQNTSWEPATVMSQCTTNSCWIMQENGTEETKGIGEQDPCSRSDAPRQKSSRQGTGTAN